MPFAPPSPPKTHVELSQREILMSGAARLPVERQVSPPIDVAFRIHCPCPFLIAAAILLIAICSSTSAADQATTRRSPSVEEVERLWPENPEFLPTDFRPVKGAKIVHVAVPGRKIGCFDRIDRLTASGPVRFLLIPEEGNQEAFYLMENKVWYDLFIQFDREKLDPKQRETWKRTAEGYQKAAGLTSPGKLPVFDVDHDRAQEFAKWLCGPGGKLPTADEWDRAAKWRHDSKHPTVGPFKPALTGETLDIAVGLKFPWEIGKGKHDIAASGCCQMSGNGEEWTSSEVALAPMNFMLRGRSFTALKPLSFADFNDDQFGIQNVASPFVSFRVALEIKADTNDQSNSSAVND